MNYPKVRSLTNKRHNFSFASHFKRHVLAIVPLLLAFQLMFVSTMTFAESNKYLLWNQHTGIQVVSPTHMQCPQSIIVRTRSALVGPMFAKDERFLKWIFSDKIGGSQAACIKRGMNTLSLPTSVVHNGKEVAEFVLVLEKASGSYGFITSYSAVKYRQIVPVSLPAKPSFYDRAIKTMALKSFSDVFPKLSLEPLELEDYQEIAVQEADGLLLAAVGTGKSKIASDYRQAMFYNVSRPCEGDQSLMKKASSMGDTVASFNVARCLFAEIYSEETEVADISVDDRLSLVYYLAKTMHPKRKLVDGYDLSVEMSRYGLTPDMKVAYATMENLDVNATYKEFIESLIARMK